MSSNSPLPQITLAMIVKNEEKHLFNCLSTSQKIWQQLVIVDTGSTDNTKNIAREFGAEIYDFQWQDDFSAARNFALEKVNTPWVMTLDADDIIETSDQDKLITEINKYHLNFSCLIMPYIYSGTKSNPILTHFVPRFWKSSLNLRYTRKIHEYLNLGESVKRAFLTPPIIHNKQTSHLHSIERNIRLLKEVIQKNPDDLESIAYLGFEHEAKQDFYTAKQYYLDYLNKKPQDVIRLSTVYTKLGIISIRFSDYSSAKDYLQKAILIGPDFIEAYLYLAELEMNIGSIPKAIKLLESAKMLRIPEKISVTNIHLYNNVAEELLTIAKNKSKI